MSLPCYPEYKDSGEAWLGEVPGHWEIIQSRRLFAQFRVPALPGDEQLSATQKYGVVPQRLFMEIEDQKVMLALSGLENFKHVEPEDFVISLRSFQGGIERSKYGGCVSPAYTVLRCTREFEPAYWASLLKSEGYISALQTMTDGIRDGKNISYSQFGGLCIPLPKLEEQTAIATFLDRETAKIDGLIAEQEKLIALLAEKRQATISHAVTKGLNPDAPMKDSGVAWLGEVPAHWDRVQLGRLCKAVSDGPHFSPNYVPEGVMFLSARNIKVDGWSLDDAKYVSEENYAEFSKRIVPEKGDVLYTKGGTTGIARVVDLEERFQVWVHVAVLKLHMNIAIPYFVAYALNSIGCYEQAQLFTRGATNQDLGLTRMIRILLALPPLEEQQAIVCFLNSEIARLDQLTAEATRGIALLKERRSALISAAVTGKIDVRHLAEQKAA